MRAHTGLRPCSNCQPPAAPQHTGTQDTVPLPSQPTDPTREEADIQGWTEIKPQPHLFRKILAGGPGHPLYPTVPKCPKLDLSLAHFSVQSS